MANKHVNAIVIGAGAGGGVVAKQLAVNGISVVLFERGSWQSFNDHDNDELISQRTTPLGNAFGPDNERYRREKHHIAAEELPLLTLLDKNETEIFVSDDERQRICVQCHAPNAFHQAGTSDDRTPRGVHEGLGCLACHETHAHDTRQSCGQCHPALSNCGLDVKTMNTTFSNPKSPYNIHFVDCVDCHTNPAKAPLPE